MHYDERMRIECVAIAGGGTGGHLVPGLAVAEALRAGGVERIVFIGTARGLETRMVPAAGYQLELISIGGFKNKGVRRQLGTLARLPGAIFESGRILRRHRAAAVLGIGGYASGPALAAARLAGIPMVLLEVNVQAGLANRLAARWAAATAINFAEAAPAFRHPTVTGIPVRAEFFRLGEPVEPPQLLIVGGSQGAKALNEVLPAAAAEWQRRGLRARIRHQSGAAAPSAVAAAYAAAGVAAEVVPFIDDMPAAVGEAGLVICRSGAGTLGELAAAGRPSILVPLPTAADQHQLRNAVSFARAGAALCIEQAALTATHLADQVQSLLEAPTRRAAMAAAARRLARPDATAAIAHLVLQVARQ